MCGETIKYKNENMGAPKTNVGKVIIFKDEDERDRFIKLYKDIIYKYVYDSNELYLYITLSKNDFVTIVKGAGLTSVEMGIYKTRYWKTEGAVV